MKAKLKTIMAGPDGHLDAGSTVEVSGPDDALVVGGFAVMETAMLDPATETRASAADIKVAANQLDHTDDDDWTAGGLPDLARIRDLTGDATLTRKQINAATDSAKRE